MDQFGMELGDHGEIALDLTEGVHDKFSPRRTRSGRVLDSKLTRRQEAARSRNSSGQSGTGSAEEDCSSETDTECPNSEGDIETAFSCYLKRDPRCRLDLSENSQEIPLTSPFLFENLLSPKKFKVQH